VNTDNKIYLEADIKLEEETPELKEQASKIIELPNVEDKQPDLLYCSAVFVSTGENLNHAYFMGSELITAEGTIVNKAMDIEHSEENVIGHIYKREFMDQAGNSSG
jgi:thioredoxin reductase